jgi:O-antigen/teichoic acid export membrane protein
VSSDAVRARGQAAVLGRMSPWLVRHRQLLVNAGSLFGSTLLTAGLGALYWAIAARVLPPSAVGVGAAAISSMQLLAQLATFGLGTVLMGELAEHHRSDLRLIGSALGLVATIGVALAVIFVLVSSWLVPALAGLRIPIGVALFAAGVAATAAGLVLDQALLGLLRGGLQLLRNGIASVAKLVALVLVGLLIGGQLNGLAILVTWVLGSLLSMVVLLAIRSGAAVSAGHSIWRAIEGVAGLALRHHLLNLSILAPGLLLPLVITTVLSPEANAYFYIAYLIASFGWAIPAAMSTAVYAAGSRDIESLPGRVRVAFALCFAAGLAINLVLFVAAPFVLAIFGPAYAAQATTLLRLFGLGIFPITLNSLFVPIARVERRFLGGAVLMALSMLIEFTFVVFGARSGGLEGAGIGWLVGYALSILPFVPTIVRVAIRREVRPIARDFLGPVPAGGRRDPSPAAGGRRSGTARRAGRMSPRAAPLDLLRRDDWTIGLVDRPIESFLGGPDTAAAVTWLPRRPGTYAADPFGLEREGGVDVFFEEYDQRHGRGTIAHVRVAPGGVASSPETIIDPGCHSSYPFLLCADGETWLIPETADLREVRLYRAVELPLRWELAGRLLTGEPVSDPTVIFHGDRWWLFGTSRGRGVNSALRLWHAPALTGPWTPHRDDPVKIDPASSRPAGTPFVHAGSLYRPGQDCSRRYGGRVVVNRIDILTPERFAETPTAVVGPFAALGYPAGLHTLSRVGRRTLVDGNVLRFAPAQFIARVGRLSGRARIAQRGTPESRGPRPRLGRPGAGGGP